MIRSASTDGQIDAAARFRSLVEQLPGVAYMLAVDADGVPTSAHFVSSQTDEMLGVPAAAWQDQREWMQRVHPDDRAALEQARAEMMATGLPQIGKFRWRRSDAGEIWLSDTGSLVCYANGERYLQGVIFDVSDAMAAQAQQERMESELRLSQRLQAVGQLAAGIAHEINTPIQFVGDALSFARESFDEILELTALHQALLRSDEVPSALTEQAGAAEEHADLGYLRERVPAAFERAVDGIERVAAIVRAMRAFGHPTTDKSQVDLVQALQDTLVVAASEYRLIADVETDLQGLPPVLANRGELNQVFLNLIVNAAHAIADKGAAAGERGTISVATRCEDDHVLIAIGDTGCGIAPEVAERVFDPFFTTKEVGRGTGQGLAIARTMVVERHAGTLTFDSEPGQGTTFYVRLPCGGDEL